MANNTPKVPQIRFKGFTDAWVKRKLGECATFSKGIGYSTRFMNMGAGF